MYAFIALYVCCVDKGQRTVNLCCFMMACLCFCFSCRCMIACLQILRLFWCLHDLTFNILCLSALGRSNAVYTCCIGRMHSLAITSGPHVKWMWFQ